MESACSRMMIVAVAYLDALAINQVGGWKASGNLQVTGRDEAERVLRDIYSDLKAVAIHNHPKSSAATM